MRAENSASRRKGFESIAVPSVLKLRVSRWKSEGDFLRFPQSLSVARAKPFLSAGFRATFPQGLWIS
jgi:hypothetical protein